MLNIKRMRAEPEVFRRGLERRGLDGAVVDMCLQLDAERRQLMTRVQGLRFRRNRVSEELAAAKKAGYDISVMVSTMKSLGEELDSLEAKLDKVSKELHDTLFNLPNIPHESVPDGASEEENVMVRSWGSPRADGELMDHVDIMQRLGLADLDAAAKIAGARFYFLMDELVFLNLALIRFALDFLSGKGFRVLQPPYMIQRRYMEGAVAFQDFQDMLYKIEGEDLYLVGTAEHPIAGIHAGEILDGRVLPLRYAGVSPCFRKEAGAHGKDTKGIFRVHQFEKVEQFVFCKPSQSWDEHELLIRNAEEIYISLGLPYRVVNICIGELGPIAAKKYDLEVWMPAQRRYRELVSCSNCTDYQANRLEIRYREAPHIEETQHVHTLNSTAIATERTIAAILENYQNRDGTVDIPEVLHAYMPGITKLKPKNRSMS
ncbi:MAG: serine--tRNA ligase [Nitrososphaerota archaeon]